MERVERSFADLEYESRKRKTRRERFLERMEVLIPWERLLDQIRPYYPKAGKGSQTRALPSLPFSQIPLSGTGGVICSKTAQGQAFHAVMC